MRIGIIFGGNSREREISFAGGRTIFDNLDKDIFTPIPIFIDSFGHFILLHWENLYKGSIRDFYPPSGLIPPSWMGVQGYAESLPGGKENKELIDSIGKKIAPEELASHIDFAFLCLHGRNGEDGSIQGLLQFLQIPYSGSGIFSSALGMNKAIQKKWSCLAGFTSTRYFSIDRNVWQAAGLTPSLLQKIQTEIGYPFVIRPANQGSSIGVSILKDPDINTIKKAIDQAFFIRTIRKSEWQDLSHEEKLSFIQDFIDFRRQPGLPASSEGQLLVTPSDLYSHLDHHFSHTGREELVMAAADGESKVLFEEFIDGREFSCIVIRDENGIPIALPPTEIKKGQEVYDYRAKYLAGLSRKVTPIQLPDEEIERIRGECVKLFRLFHFQVYARIDGFIRKDGSIILNDPNTTSGMLPSSFFFHQAAEIGLNPSQFISYIIYTSIQERINEYAGDINKLWELRQKADKLMLSKKEKATEKINVAVILGGYSSERHISVESGRNIFEKLSSSKKYRPRAIFLCGEENEYRLYEIPINILLKDNADDIKEKILHYKPVPLLESIKQTTQNIQVKYTDVQAVLRPKEISLAQLAEETDFAFVALHGRPGEDGTLQSHLEAYGIPYNGSDPASSAITIDKYRTNQLLRKHGICVADQLLVAKKDWEKESAFIISRIETELGYPFIMKPHDDGCSAAVKLIKNRDQLCSYTRLIFGTNPEWRNEDRQCLGLKEKEEFPYKDCFLAEEYISKGDCLHFLEVTGGLLTHHTSDGVSIEIFTPSETLANSEVLSLEEKFLAGEGQNITPARFSKDPVMNEKINRNVKKVLYDTAKILSLQGYARIDAFVKIFENEKVETFIIEVNSLPGMTPATCIFHQAALSGYNPYQFIDQIISYGVKKTAIQAH